MRIVEEQRPGGEVPLWLHPEWTQRFPWLAQGTTGAGDGSEPFDLGLAGAQPVGAAVGRWRALRSAVGVPAAVHSRQVHGAELLPVPAPLPPGLLVTEGYDGLLTDRPGVLLSVAIADCVPVFLLDPERRALALVHAGWRGVAAGIVEAAAAMLQTRYGSGAAALWLHCGPAICGRCYEVGPEVHQAVRPGQAPPATPTPIDLRAAIGQRAAALGVAPERVSVSGHCTRCGPGGFFSHRGGSAARQMAVLGIRP